MLDLSDLLQTETAANIQNAMKDATKYDFQILTEK